LLHAGVEEAFAKNALADHAGCSEEDDVHGLMLQRRGIVARVARPYLFIQENSVFVDGIMFFLSHQCDKRISLLVANPIHPSQRA
jgi:hypothetical protein